MRDGWRKTGPGLYRRGDTWRAVLRFRMQGRIRVLQRTGTGPQNDARKALAAMRVKAHELRAGSLTVRAGGLSTLGDALDYYAARADLTRSNAGPYLGRLKAELGSVRLAELRERFSAWLVEMRRCATRYGRPPSNATMNRYLAWGKAAVGLCVRDGLLDTNPLARLDTLPETPRDVTLRDGDRQRLLNAVAEKAPHLLPLVTFASLVPTRRGELVNMRREDVDLFNGVIRLRSGTTKNRDGRYLPIPAECRAYFGSIPAECPWAFYRKVGGTRSNRDVRYLPLGDFKRAWGQCVKAAGLVGLRFHDLRAYSATALLAAGNDVRAVMATAGWRTDMLRVYYRRDGLNIARTVRFGVSGTPNVNVGCEGPAAEAVATA